MKFRKIKKKGKRFGRRVAAIMLATALVVTGTDLSAFSIKAEAESDTTNPETTDSFTIEGGTADSDYILDGTTLTIKSDAPLTISGGAEGSPITGQIKIAENVKVNLTLDGLYLTGQAGSSGVAGSSSIDLTSTSELTLTLAANSENKLTGGTAPDNGIGGPGIHVPGGATLTIQGSGKLDVTGGGLTGYTGSGGVGIGGAAFSDGYGESCGTVVITGGTVSVTGSTSAYGIGGGIGGGAYQEGFMGSVIITGGTVSVASDNAANPSIGGRNQTDSGVAVILVEIANLNGASITSSACSASIVPNNRRYQVSGALTLPDLVSEYTLPANNTLFFVPLNTGRSTLTIPDGVILNIPEGVIFSFASYDSEQVLADRITNNGTVRIACNHEKYKEYAEAIGGTVEELHDWENGKCTNCNEPHNHDDAMDWANKDGVCITCGGTHEHKESDWANKDGVCATCGMAHTHADSDWTYTKGTAENTIIATCDVCKKEVVFTLTAPTENLTYDGTAKTATVTMNPDGVLTAPEITYSAEGNVNAGEVTASIQLGDVTASVPYTIASRDASSATVGISGTYTYTGSAIVPDANNVSVKLGDKTLVYDTDYTFTASDNVNAGIGTATLTVNFKGNYSGSAKGTFNIGKAASDATVSKANSLTYTGGDQALVTADTVAGGTLMYSLEENGTYTAEIPTGRNVGEYTVWYYVKGDDNHKDTGKASVMVSIAKAEKAPYMPGSVMIPANSKETVGDVGLPIGWEWNADDKLKAMEVGTPVTASAIYAGTDKGNYEKESVEITLTRSACEHTHTEIQNAKEATCKEKGNTGDVFCTDCQKTISLGAEIPFADHKGGTATCIHQAVCEVCGVSYGELDISNHVHTELRGQVAATSTQAGYTGDTYCNDCQKTIQTGSSIPATGSGNSGSSSGGSSGGGYVPIVPPSPVMPSSEPTLPIQPTKTPEKEAYQAPVSGTSQQTVEVKAEITDGNAVVEEITEETLRNVISDKTEMHPDTDKTPSDKITLDFSGAKQEVSAITLSKTSMEVLAKTVADSTNTTEKVVIKLSNATITLDSKTLQAISSQAQGDTVKIVVDHKKAEELNPAQQTSLAKHKVVAVVDVYVESGDNRIHDFNGGNVVVSIPFQIEEGRKANCYHVYYVADDGSMKPYPTKYADGVLQFTTTHFSDYVIVYDETKQNDTEAVTHTHTITMIEAKTASCEEAGNLAYWYCAECDTYFADAEGKTKTTKAAVTIPATGHQWDAGTVTKEPTETETGIKTYTCTVCGKTKTEEIPATGKKEQQASKLPKKGTVVKDDKKAGKYVISSQTKKEVTYIAPVNKKAKTITIPATIKVNGISCKVTKIADNAFKNNKNITKVTIGSNVKTIGKSTFYGCKKLKTVKIGKSVTTIGASAFQGCSALTSITLGSNVKTIGKNAFYKCTALTKITIPSKVTSIGSNAFNGCKKLKTLTIKSTKLTSKNVSKNAFKGLTKYTTIKVPKKKLASYKKLFKSKGLSSKVKVKGY